MKLVPGYLSDLVMGKPGLAFVGRMAALLALFVLVDHFMARAGFLDATSYAQPVLIIEVCARLGPLIIIGMLALAIALSRYGGLLDPWSALGAGTQLRGFVVFLAVLMAWPFSLYEYNHFFEQGHYLDRALIMVLVPLIYYRPVFVFPFLVLSYTIMWQFGQPPIGFGAIFAHKLQVLHVLNLFAAVLLVHAATGSRHTDDFLVFTCCLVASAYWVPALTKMELGWLSHGQLYHMPLAAYAHGWLAFLDPQTIVAFANVVSWFDRPMLIYTILFEFGCIVILWRRALSIGLLASAIVFHIGVFVLYGYIFWTWISLNAAVLLILFRDRKTQKFDIYRPRYFLVSIVLILFAPYWCHPSALAWLDTQLSYTYRIEAIGASGQRYSLDSEFFAPYSDVLTMGNFPYLVRDHGNLVAPYGITRDRARADAVTPIKTSDEVFALEADIAQIKYDPEHAAQFYEFIVRYVRNRTAHPDKGAILRMVSPPAQFQNFGRGNIYRGQEPVRYVVVRSITMLFDGARLDIIRDVELARLEIDPG